LAWEAARDDINGNSIPSKNVGCEGSNIFIARHLWPVFRQYFAGEWFNFAESDGFKSACAFKAKRESRRCPRKDQALLAYPSASLLMCLMLRTFLS
jgi:hypothetical protein